MSATESLYAFPEPAERLPLHELIRINGERMAERERWARIQQESGRNAAPIIEQLRMHEQVQDMLLHIAGREKSFKCWWANASKERLDESRAMMRGGR